MDVLACPDGHASLELKASREVNGNIVEGILTCLTCNREYEIKDGIPMLYFNKEQTIIEKWWELSDAPLVDHMFMRGIDPYEQPIRCRIRDEAVANGDSVLDVGCATCIDYPLYREAGLHYVGVDFTYKLLAGALKHTPDVPVVQGDAKKLPFKNESFNSVYVKDVLVHLPLDVYKKVLEEMWRVTKKVLMVACGISADTVKECRYNITEIRPEVGYKYASQSSSYTKASIVDALSNLPRFDCLKTDDIKLEGESSSGYRVLFMARKKTV
ncbi:hypothetical protein A3K79_03540 [Candidatus Bathyarchaeota archaeon RBG_13_46_16b]|nr:MAG: hypothetical protein A3K79_03540 [Candidatus Bathyarchaeota archaeon RBG_13_46_16b]